MSVELRQKVLSYVDSRVSASAGEVSKALDITIQRAGRYLKSLLNDGDISIDHTNDHVPYYSTVRRSNSEERVTRDVTEAHAKDTPEIVEKCMDAAFGDVVRQAEKAGYDRGLAEGYEEIIEKCMDAALGDLVKQAEKTGYDRGFSNGYDVGRAESARSAYADGKEAVIRKLGELLLS